MFLRDAGRVERGDKIEAFVDVAFLNAVFGFGSPGSGAAQRVVLVIPVRAVAGELSDTSRRRDGSRSWW